MKFFNQIIDVGPYFCHQLARCSYALLQQLSQYEIRSLNSTYSLSKNTTNTNSSAPSFRNRQVLDGSQCVYITQLIERRTGIANVVGSWV